MNDIRWIFFDLGSTLIDETEADLRRIREMTKGTNVTKEAYCEKRLEMIHLGRPGDQAAIEFFGLRKTPWHSEDEVPYPDSLTTLSELNRHGFKLGIIANQNPGTEAADGIMSQIYILNVTTAIKGIEALIKQEKAKITL